MTGFFVTIDGPSGIGKSTVTGVIAQRLTEHGYSAMATKEPTSTPLGNLVRFGTDEYQGLTLACLVAADRYQHLVNEIHPALEAGHVVICDRYVASSLVLQNLDGVPTDFVWQLNQHAQAPGLSVILTGEPTRAREQANRRGLYSRFHRGGLARTASEIELCGHVAQALETAGWPVSVHHIRQESAHTVTDTLCAEILGRISAC